MDRFRELAGGIGIGRDARRPRLPGEPPRVGARELPRRVRGARAGSRGDRRQGDVGRRRRSATTCSSGLVEMRREVGRLRRALVSHREVVLALTRPELEAIASSDSAERFTSLRDRLEEAVQASRDTRESIVGSFDVLLASTGQRTNEIMKVLTLASVLLLPGRADRRRHGHELRGRDLRDRCVLLGGHRAHRGGRGRDARRRQGARVDLTEYREGSSLPPMAVHPSRLSGSRSRRSRSSSGSRSPPARSSRSCSCTSRWTRSPGCSSLPSSRWRSTRRSRRSSVAGSAVRRAAAIVFVVAFAALGLLGFLVIPPLVTATTDFVEALPGLPARPRRRAGARSRSSSERFHLGEQLVDVYERGGIAGSARARTPGSVDRARRCRHRPRAHRRSVPDVLHASRRQALGRRRARRHAAERAAALGAGLRRDQPHGRRLRHGEPADQPRRRNGRGGHADGRRSSRTRSRSR